MKTTDFALVLLLLTSTAAYGASATEATGEFFQHMKQKEFNAAAAMFDPSALTEFRQSLNIINEAPAQAQQQFREAFFGAEATVDSIAAMSDSEFFASFLRAALAQAEAIGTIDFDDMEILGEVMEGPDLAHVVTRNTVSVGEVEVEGMEVVSCRKQGDEWKLLVSTQMKGLANQIRAALAQVPK